MPFYVYILYSQVHDRYYIGQTDNVGERLQRHNNGYEKSTSSFIPWAIKFVIEKQTRGEAMILEKKIKNLNRKKLLLFIEKYSDSL
jgi:putative endonuclease